MEFTLPWWLTGKKKERRKEEMKKGKKEEEVVSNLFWPPCKQIVYIKGTKEDDKEWRVTKKTMHCFLFFFF